MQVTLSYHRFVEKHSNDQHEKALAYDSVR